MDRAPLLQFLMEKSDRTIRHDLLRLIHDMWDVYTAGSVLAQAPRHSAGSLSHLAKSARSALNPLGAYHFLGRFQPIVRIHARQSLDIGKYGKDTASDEAEHQEAQEHADTADQLDIVSVNHSCELDLQKPDHSTRNESPMNKVRS